jgi:ribonuclease HI
MTLKEHKRVKIIWVAGCKGIAENETADCW